MSQIAAPSAPSLAAQLRQAIACHRRGQLERAERCYARILRLAPRHVDALHLSAVIHAQWGDFPQALHLLRQVLAIKPDFAEAHLHLGHALAGLSRWNAALQSYRRACELAPQLSQAHYGCGVLLERLGQPAGALASYERALAIDERCAQAHFSRGNVLWSLQDPHAALASYARAIELKADYSEAYCNRAELLRCLGQPQAALSECERAIAHGADSADTYLNRGNILRELGRRDEALASYDRAIALRADNPEAYTNRGELLRELGELAAALASHERALALRPAYAVAHCNRGAVLYDLQQLQASLTSYRRAIQLQAGYAQAHLGSAFVALLQGDFATGWREYEWRTKLPARGHSRPERAVRSMQWSGSEPLAGRTLLLQAEQGLGDTLQFCRFVTVLAGMGARVILQAPEPLLRVLASLRGVAQLIGMDGPAPEHDYHCALLSVPYLLGVDSHSLPACTPYLSADPARVAAWRLRLGATDVPRVGLVWSGSAAHHADRSRSIALAQLIDHLPGGIDYVSLQKEVRETDQPSLAAHPRLVSMPRELRDFGDTAALCECLDLVLTVDSSVAHLSGALARPTLLLLPFAPDWRWLLGRDDSPWYPSFRLLRQETPGDWKGVLRRAAEELCARCTGRSSRA